MSDITIADCFPRYTQFHPLVPVWCVTPKTPRTIHRYFDSSPFSPSGRYLITAQLPAEDRLPRPGDVARIFVVDLANGEERCVAETRGWDTQVGPNAQWGSDDYTLYFNDIEADTWRPFGVRLDLRDGCRTPLEGSIYSVSRDGTLSISPCLRRTGLVQAGYGVIVPPQFIPQTSVPADDDGIFITDLKTGKQRLLVSMRDLLSKLDTPCGRRGNEPGLLVGFHMCWNPQADRIMFILRWMPTLSRSAMLSRQLRGLGSRIVSKAARTLGLAAFHRAFRPPPMVYNTLVVLRSDGTEPRAVVPPNVYARGGHHPNWCPDGRSILMNLNVEGKLRIVRFWPEEQRSQVLSSQLLGSGHPTLHPHERYILTDAYEWGRLAYGDGTVPLRLIDWAAGTERVVARVATRPNFYGPKRELRIDPHPAWDRQFMRIAFNANSDGTRRVYVADLSAFDL